MSYIGQKPLDTYSSLAVQHFTTSATASYTLDQSVTSENDIRLIINGVVQQPGASYAYTCAGSSLTLSSAITSADTMHCVFIGKSIGTINPPDGSVSDAKITAMASSKLTGSVAVANGGTGITAVGTSGNVLTSTGSAWASTAPAGGGKVLQLAYTTASFTSTAINTTSNTWTDTDVLITFTPSSTASKFVVSFGIGSAVNADADDGGYGYRIKKVQDSTTSYPSRLTDYTGSNNIHSRRYFYSSNVSSVNNWFEYDTFQGVDADSHTTSSLTYTIQCAQLNLDNNLTIGNVGNAIPQMMVMEIAN